MPRDDRYFEVPHSEHVDKQILSDALTALSSLELVDFANTLRQSREKGKLDTKEYFYKVHPLIVDNEIPHATAEAIWRYVDEHIPTDGF